MNNESIDTEALIEMLCEWNHHDDKDNKQIRSIEEQLGIAYISVDVEKHNELQFTYYFEVDYGDPPYFSGPEKRKYYGNEINKLNIRRINYRKLENSWELPNEEYFNELRRVSKNQIVWGCNYYAKHISSVGRIIWDKVNGTSSFSDAEIASSSFHDSVRLFSFMWNGMMQGADFKGTMQGDKSLNEKRIHPTQKPVALYKWLLDKYGKLGDKILDTHLGSGSIAIACFDFGFELTACELDEDYYNDSIKRIKNHVANNQSLFAPEELLTPTLF